MRCKFLLFCVILETFLFVVKSKIRFDNGDYDNILCHVDTRIGTDLWKKESTLSNAERPHGFVYPGVGLPFAMTQWTPQTVIMI